MAINKVQLKSEKSANFTQVTAFYTMLKDINHFLGKKRGEKKKQTKSKNKRKEYGILKLCFIIYNVNNLLSAYTYIDCAA